MGERAKKRYSRRKSGAERSRKRAEKTVLTTDGRPADVADVADERACGGTAARRRRPPHTHAQIFIYRHTSCCNARHAVQHADNSATHPKARQQPPQLPAPSRSPTTSQASHASPNQGLHPHKSRCRAHSPTSVAAGAAMTHALGFPIAVHTCEFHISDQFFRRK